MVKKRLSDVIGGNITYNLAWRCPSETSHLFSLSPLCLFVLAAGLVKPLGLSFRRERRRAFLALAEANGFELHQQRRQRGDRSDEQRSVSEKTDFTGVGRPV